MNKHLSFLHITDRPKTMVWVVKSTHNKSSLGIVKWYPSWRQYCFFPDFDCVFSKDCLLALEEFLGKVNKNKKIISEAVLEKREWNE